MSERESVPLPEENPKAPNGARPARVATAGRKMTIESGLTAPMSEHFLKKLEQFYDIDGALPNAFRDICSDRVEFAPETCFARQEGAYEGTFLIDNGWVIRAKTLQSGARQIVNVAIPGDFVGLNAILFAQSEFDLVAKTHVRAYRFRPEALFELFMRFPAFAAALFWVNAMEERILAERIVSLGRRPARQRTAHVLCELVARMRVIGVEAADQLILPISQEDFSDIVGISLVHMNRTLKALEADEVIVFRNEILTIVNMEKLKRIAGFDGDYLHFATRPDRVRRGGAEPALLGPDGRAIEAEPDP